MKFLFTLFFTCIFASAFTQATTQSEYNYIKRGLKDVDEKGMDAKSGYTLGEMEQSEFGTVTVYLRPVYRDVDNSIAGISIVTFQTALLGDTKKYYCLPAPSLESKKSYGLGDWQTDVDLMNSTEMKAVLKMVSYFYTIEAVYHVRAKK